MGQGSTSKSSADYNFATTIVPEGWPTGFNWSKIFYLPDFQVYAFFNLLIQNIEGNIAQIH